MIAGLPQRFLRHFIKLRHLIFARDCPGAIASPTLQQFLPQPAALVNLQQVNRNVLRRQRRQFLQRLPPTLFRLVRQPCNQVKADIPSARLAQDRNRTVNIRPPVHPARGNQFLVRERLQPKAHSVNSGAHPGRRLLSLNRLRVRLQRHLRQIRHKCSPDHIQDVLQMRWVQKARRPPTYVNRVHHGFVAQPLLLALSLPNGAVRLSCQVLTHPSRPEQLAMLPNLPANRLHVWRKSAAGHYSRMKIAIRTLRLAERHLHVNPKLPHCTKTLAHPWLNPATFETMNRESYGESFSTRKQTSEN